MSGQYKTVYTRQNFYFIYNFREVFFMILLPRHIIKKMWHLSSMTSFTHHFPLNTNHKIENLFILLTSPRTRTKKKEGKAQLRRNLCWKIFEYYFLFLPSLHPFSSLLSFISLIVRDLFIVFILIITVSIQYKSQWGEEKNENFQL